MKIEVRLPDGTILEFPEGTPDEVMQRVAAEQSRRPTASDVRSAVADRQRDSQRQPWEPTAEGRRSVERLTQVRAEARAAGREPPAPDYRLMAEGDEEGGLSRLERTARQRRSDEQDVESLAARRRIEDAAGRVDSGLDPLEDASRTGQGLNRRGRAQPSPTALRSLEDAPPEGAPLRGPDADRSMAGVNSRLARQEWERGEESLLDLGRSQDRATFTGTGRAEDELGDVTGKFLQNLDDRVGRVVGGMISALPEIANSISPGAQMMERLVPPEVRDGPVEAWVRGAGRGIFDRATAELQRNDPTATGGLRFAYDALNVFTDVGLALGAAGLTRSPSVGAAVSGVQIFGDRYGESLAAGRTPEQAFQDATVYGFAEFISEKLVIGRLMRPGGSMLRRAGAGALAEGMQEAFTETLQTAYDAGVIGEEMTWGEAFRNIVYSGLLGGAAGGGIGAIAHPLARGPREEIDLGAPEMYPGQAAFERDARGAPDSPLVDPSTPPPIRPGAAAPLPPGPLGVRERAESEEALASPSDERSPLDTSYLTQGRRIMAQAGARSASDRTLEENGLPITGSRVSINFGDRAVTGTVIDVIEHEDAELGKAAGVRIRQDDGTIFQEFFDTIRSSGISITATAPPPAPAAAPTPAPPAPAGPAPGGRRGVAGAADGFSLQSYMAAARGAESGGNDNAANPRSSASGRYQFIDSTFNSVFRQVYGRAPTAGERNDPAVQDRLMERFTQDNIAALQRARIPVNNGTVYAAHHFGSGGAVEMARNPGAAVDADVVRANPQLRGMTNGQALDWAASYVNRSGGGAGSGGAGMAPASEITLAAPEPLETPISDAIGTERTEISSATPPVAPGDTPPSAEPDPLRSRPELGPTFADPEGEISRAAVLRSALDGRRTANETLPGYSNWLQREGFAVPQGRGQRPKLVLTDAGRAELARLDEASGRAADDRARGETAAAETSTPAAPSVPTIEPTASGKGLTITNATPAQVEAIRAALPANASLVEGKSGGLSVSRKYEDVVRSAVAPAPASDARQIDNPREYARPWQDQFEQGHPARIDPDAAEWRQQSIRIADLSPETLELARERYDTETNEAEFPDAIAALRAQPITEPIVAVRTDGQTYVWDGLHRIGAALASGQTELPAIVGEPTPSPESAGPVTSGAPALASPGAGAEPATIASLERLVRDRKATLNNLPKLARQLGVTEAEANAALGALASRRQPGFRMTKGRPARFRTIQLGGGRTRKRQTAKAVPARYQYDTQLKSQMSPLSFVRSLGGVASGRHDLRNVGALARHPGVISRKGLSVDEVGRALWEAGYFENRDPTDPDQRPTEAETIDFLDRASMGRPQAQRDPDAPPSEEMDDEEAEFYRRRVTEIAEEAGIAFNVEEIEDAVRYMAAGETDANAVYRAVDDASARVLETLEEQSGEPEYPAARESIYEGELAEERGGGFEEGLAGPESVEGDADGIGTPDAESAGGRAPSRQEELKARIRAKITGEPESAEPDPPTTERPLAADGLTSYRYKGPLGWVMIGARDQADALNEARRSVERPDDVSAENLQVWNGSEYEPVGVTKPVTRPSRSTVETEGGKVIIRGAEQSELDAIRAALPEGVRPLPRADGVFTLPKKHEAAARAALRGETPAPAKVRPDPDNDPLADAILAMNGETYGRFIDELNPAPSKSKALQSRSLHIDRFRDQFDDATIQAIVERVTGQPVAPPAPAGPMLDLLGNPIEEPGAAAAREAAEAMPDMFGEREGDQRRALERKGEGRKKGTAPQKAAGSDGGIFDTAETTGDLTEPAPASPAQRVADELVRRGFTRKGPSRSFELRVEGAAEAGTVSDGARVVTVGFDEQFRYLERYDGFDVAKDVDLREFADNPAAAVDAVLEGSYAAAPAKAPAGVPKGRPGMMVGQGETYLTATGRQTTPVPKVAAQTDRQSTNAIRRLEGWLIENARAEAAARGDDFNGPMFNRMEPKKLSQSDMDILNEYLFGDEQPPVIPSILKELSPAKPTDYGARNKLVTKDRAEELRAKMRDRFKNITAGVDPELMAMGAELAVFHIEAGARKFADFARAIRADLGLTMEQLRPFLRSWYNGARDMMEDMGAPVADMDGPDQVRAALSALQEEGNVPATSGGLESDRGGATAQNENGEPALPVDGGEDGRGARGGEPEAGTAGDGEPGTPGLFDVRPASVGAGGDSGVRDGSPAARGGASERGGRGRGGNDGDAGSPDERTPAAAVRSLASDSAGVEQKRAIQRAANALPVITGDRANIEATLPFLREGQRDDVAKAEESFTKRHGFMLTNGTGTGKTFSGGGVVARLYRQGRREQLIVAPSQDILRDWQAALAELGVDANILDSTSTAGSGVTLTTYANLATNEALADRVFDLVVTDESHKLLSGKKADVTGNLETFRAITNHPQGRHERARRQLRREWALMRSKTHGLTGRRLLNLSEETQAAERALDERTNELARSFADQPRTKALFLSATPWAYVKTIDYAEGYLFNFDTAEPGTRQAGYGYNQPDPRQQFFIQHFGYRMRNNKLTEPDAAVNSEVMEREFHEWLKREGALSGRVLDVDADYDRRFVLVADGIGQQIDQALEFLSSAEDGRFRPLADLVYKNFDYLRRMRLLEAINAQHAIADIRAHHALGRKVVVFHQYNEGGGFNPFALGLSEESEVTVHTQAGVKKVKLLPLFNEFVAKNPYVPKLDFSRMRSPLETLTREFPDALLYNGRVPSKARTEAKRLFNQDGSGRDLIIVQTDAGEAGISLHDTTGKHQRVIINLGLPVRPMTAIQLEGRTYRDGQVTDAIFRYMTTGTAWERAAFAQKVAERASTAENLAMGEAARALRQSFIDAYTDADTNPPAAGEGTGGKAGDRANNAISAFERAKSFYFGQQKNTRRRDQREGVDYFATPEPVGFKMVEWAGLRVGEKVLEPSAGHGAIARFFPEFAERTVVEPSTELATRAALASPGARMFDGRFEELNIVNKYDAIVMNPPYGAGGKTAMEHVTKAAVHLRNGGRIVALIPTGPAADKRFDAMMESAGLKGVYEVARIDLPAVTFERAGTAVRTRIVVLERQNDESSRDKLRPSAHRDLSNAETVNELFDRLEDMTLPERVEPVTKEEAAAVSADGSVTVGGIELKLKGKDGERLTAKPKRFLEGGDFARLARLAKVAGGDYSTGNGFGFDTAEQRGAWLEAIERGDEGQVVTPSPAGPAQAGVRFETAETIHAKKGIELYVAALADRVETDEFARLRQTAKAHGGYWSSFRGNGAIPGFQFESEAGRAAFMAAEGKADLQSAPAGTARELTEDERTRLTAELETLKAKIDPKNRFVLNVVEGVIFNAKGEAGQGAYNARQAWVDLAHSANPAATLAHELAGHGLWQTNIWNAAERTTLIKAAARGGFDKWARENYGHKSAEKQVEESVAEWIAQNLAGRAEQKGFLRTALDKFADLLDVMVNGARLVFGADPTARSMLREIESGRAGRRPTGQDRRGVARDLQAAPSAFQRWFGESKVTDESGAPLVVYHGTHQDIEAFDRMASARRFGLSFNNLGLWFTNRLESGRTLYGPKTVAAYLSMQKPFVIYGHERRELAAARGGDAAWNKFWKLYDRLTDPESTSKPDAREPQRTALRDPEPMRQWLKENGYDGLIFRNTFADSPSSETTPQDFYVVLEPTQIKATTNRGTFDPNDPRIDFQAAFSDPAVEARWAEASKGVGDGAGFIGRHKGWIGAFRDGFTRHWINLPNLPVFADLQQQLRKLEAAPEAASDEVLRRLTRMVKGLDRKNYDLFTRKAVLDDLQWEADVGHKLPFGFTVQTLAAERANIDALVADPANKVVADAILLRKRMNKQLADDMVAAGVLSADQIKNPAYYRHMVLEYARAEMRIANDPKSKVTSPYWAKRMGSSLDINANLLEAEFDWMQKALVDIATAKAIAWIKESDHNIREDLRAKAKASNKGKVQALIAADTTKVGAKTVRGPIAKQDAKFRSAMGLGFKRIADELRAGNVTNIPPHFRAAAADIESGTKGGDPPFAFLAWIADNNKPGVDGALIVLKAIGQRRAWERKLLGDEYIDAEDMEGLIKAFGAEGYAAWQPIPGRHMFTAKTISEHTLDMFVNKLADAAMPGVNHDELARALGTVRTQLVYGSDRYTMILPKEVVDTLNEFGDRRAQGLIGSLFSGVQGAWKRWMLISPRRWFKYNLNNMTGDLDAIIAGNPGTLRYVKQAAKELYAVWRHQAAASQDYQDAQERGVFTSGLSVQEIPDINRLSAFRMLTEPKSNRPDKLAIAGVAAVWRALQSSTNFREAVFRYAAYLDYVQKLRAGTPQKKIGYGASLPRMVDAVEGTEDRAALLARDLIGDYGGISAAGGWLRRYMIPFWSWTEINTRRYKRLISNAAHESMWKGVATGTALGAVAGVRVGAYLGIRMAVVYGTMTLWNMLFFGDEEDELDELQKRQLHLILGRNDDGEIVTLRLQGALSDFLGLVGFPDLVEGLRDWGNNQGTLGSALMRTARAPVNRIVTSVSPFYSTPLELAIGKELWPNLWEPRQIHDNWRHMAGMFGVENEYDALTDAPSRGYGRSWQDAFVYRRDPGEMAYNDAKGMAYDWLERARGQGGGGVPSSPRSQALRLYRMAIKYGDDDAANRALDAYEAAGGTARGFATSIRRQHPLGPIAARDRQEYIDSLTPEQLETLERAEQYYVRTFIERQTAAEREAANAANEDDAIPVAAE